MSSVVPVDVAFVQQAAAVIGALSSQLPAGPGRQGSYGRALLALSDDLAHACDMTPEDRNLATREHELELRQNLVGMRQGQAQDH